MFTVQLPDLVDYINNLLGRICLVGEINVQFDDPLQSVTKQTLITLSLYNLVQVINKPTNRYDISLTGVTWLSLQSMMYDMVLDIMTESVKNIDTDLLESDHYCIKSYFSVSVSKPSTRYRINVNMDYIDHPSFTAVLSNVSELSSAEMVNYLCSTSNESISD